MHRLRRLADVEEKASIHMLRHRWITLQVVEGIRAYGNQKLPLDVATSLLSRISSMTGHSSIDSLWSYVLMTFDELGVWDRAQENHTIRSVIAAIDREIAIFRESEADLSASKRLLAWIQDALGQLLCVAASISSGGAATGSDSVAPLQVLLEARGKNFIS